MPQFPPNIVRFGDYEVDLPAGQLRKRGVKLRLSGQAFDVLALLLERPGEVVAREELRRRLWPSDVFVDFDNNLNTAIARLREALNDSAGHPRFIETLPRRGYRFIAPIAEVLPSRPRLLVLPFDDLSGSPGHEYFSDAVTEEIIGLLAGLAPEQLAVLARTTAMHYRGRERNLTAIGRELAVDYVVEGAASRTDSRISLNVHLIRVGDRSHLWTHRYEAGCADLFEIESAAAQGIAGALGIARRPVLAKLTRDPEAYNLYVQGRHLAFRFTAESFAAAQHYLKQAIARDPEFALAYDALAEMHYYLGLVGFVAPRDSLSAGLFYALRAIEIDNNLAETHALLGHFRKQLDYDWAEVDREMKLALELKPNSPLVRLRYAMNGLLPHGRLDEAIAEIDLALEFDPLSAAARGWLSALCWLSGKWDRGLTEARRMLEIDPAQYMGYFFLANNYAGKGLHEEAVSAYRRALDLSGGAPLMLGWEAIPLGKLGRLDEIRSLLARLQEMARKIYVPPTAFAWAWLGLGDIDNFFQSMDRAIEGRDHMVTGIKSYWFFSEIRADPRYSALLQRMNLAP